MTSTASLSVGVHTVTVTATDSDGGSSSESSVITIADRPLAGGGICQTDPGFGGPGSAQLWICGGDLSTGTTVDIQLTGPAASRPMWLAVALTSNPTPLFGGTFLPIPPNVLLPASTDANGEWEVPAGLSGGGGPFAIYFQVLYLDGALSAGVGISNAVQVDYLP